MADMLNNALAWLNEKRQAHLARDVTYGRGGDSVVVAATLGSTTYEIADEMGATVQAQAIDFIVAASALVIGGDTVKPEVGDTIRVDDGGVIRVFEVLDLGGVGHYRPSDPHGHMLRIHAKQIDEETT